MTPLTDYLKVFAIGGAFCAVAQILIDKTKLTGAKILVSYVVIGVFLTAVGAYQPILDFAKSGASVPLTGFGNLLAEGVKKAVDEKGLLGALTGGLSASSAGIAATVCFALVWSVIFKSKNKR